MNAELSPVAILYLLGAGQGAFLSLSLLSSRTGSHEANRYLAALTMVFCLALVDYFLDVTGLTTQYIQLRTLLWPKEFLYGTLLYFYVRELTRPGEYPLSGRQWLHFLPAFLHVLVTWPLLFLSASRQRAILSDSVVNKEPDTALAWILGDFELTMTILQITLYLLMSLRLLRLHGKRVRDTFSYTEKISLDWLRRLLYSILTVYFIWLGDELLSEWLGEEALFDALLGISMVVLIYSMGYLGLRQPTIFSRASPAITAPTEIPPPLETPVGSAPADHGTTEKYRSSPLSPDLSKALLSELRQIMDSDRPYLDARLSLPTLAERMGVSPNYLSQTINEQLEQNFFDFVNGYRIEAAKSRFANPCRDNENVLTVAMDAGFNSKSAFYTAFRKHTGMTPGQYRKSLT